MPTVLALRLLNNVIGGTTSGAQLQTALTDVPTYNHWQTLLTSSTHVQNMIESDNGWAAIKISNLALTSICKNEYSRQVLINNKRRFDDLRTNRTLFQTLGQQTGELLFASSLLPYNQVAENTINSTRGTVMYTAIYANSMYIVCGTSGELFTSPDAVTWTQNSNLRSIFTESEYVTSMVFAAGLYVVGGVNGKIATSPDLITWTARTSQFGTQQINKIIYNGSNLFVAVGGNGLISTSPDGITWTARTSQFGTTYIQDIVYNGSNLYVIVGDAGKSSTSTDGLTWTANGTPFAASSMRAIIFANALYVASGAGGVLYTSSNGTTWTTRTSNTTSTIDGLAYGNSTFVGMANLDTIYSSDGITWTRKIRPTPSNYLFFLNSTFISLGNSSLGISLSTNGIHWETEQNPLALSQNTSPIKGAAFINNQFFLGDAFSNLSFSSNGIRFKQCRTLDAGYEIRNIIFAFGNYFIFNANGNVIKSSDLITWTTVYTASAGTNYIASGNEKIMMTSSTASSFYSSHDGVTFTNRGGFGVNTVNNIIFTGNVFFILGTPSASSPVAYFSENATNISSTNLVEPTTAATYAAIFGNNLYLIAGTSGAIFSSPSPDGPWINTVTAANGGVFGTNHLCRSLGFNNGIFWAAGENGKVAYSRDGKLWTQHTKVLTSENLDNIMFGNGVMCITNLRDNTTKPLVISNI